jgi:hydroxyacylglutathione hydrolase
MKLVALPAFADNYIWLLHDDRSAVVVDPAEGEPVIAALGERSLALAGILVTHHHGDHIGGVEALLERFGTVPIWGPSQERLAFEPGAPVTRVHDGDLVELLGLSIRVIETPGHTAGHVAYSLQPPGESGLLFSGDTLFSAGCGRLFEGSAQQMHDSLSRLAALPGDTRVCCAHEYTLSNLRFAAAVEPDNIQVQRHQAHCEALRAAGLPTLPSQLLLEQAINPFLRCSQPSVRAAARSRGAASDDPIAVFTAIRAWKNEFR